MNTTVPNNSITGDTYSAAQRNNIVNAINSKQDLPIPLADTLTVATGVGAGTGATATVTHNGKVIFLSVTMGTSPSNGFGVLATITLPTPITYPPYPVFSPANTNATVIQGGGSLHQCPSISPGDCNSTTIVLKGGNDAIGASTGTYSWAIMI